MTCTPFLVTLSIFISLCWFRNSLWKYCYVHYYKKKATNDSITTQSENLNFTQKALLLNRSFSIYFLQRTPLCMTSVSTPFNFFFEKMSLLNVLASNKLSQQRFCLNMWEKLKNYFFIVSKRLHYSNSHASRFTVQSS